MFTTSNPSFEVGSSVVLFTSLLLQICLLASGVLEGCVHDHEGLINALTHHGQVTHLHVLRTAVLIKHQLVHCRISPQPIELDLRRRYHDFPSVDAPPLRRYAAVFVILPSGSRVKPSVQVDEIVAFINL